MQSTDNKLLKAIESKFVTLPGEEVVLVQRKHWSTFLFPILFSTTAGMLFLGGTVFASMMYPSYMLLFLATGFIILTFIATFSLKSVIDWYFNLYVITNRKIAELSYRPLSSRHVSEVLLDQVKCTEIDTRINGIINELLDIGDVIITFDRPTHQEEFMLADIKDPKTIEAHLERNFAGRLTTGGQVSITPVGHNWYIKREEDGEKKWKFIDREQEPIYGEDGGDSLWN